MASFGELLATLAETQRSLVALLASEYYCDDLEPPQAAFGWTELQLRDYFESGGDKPPTPAEAAGTRAAPGGAEERRPVVLCLGDSLTEFGSQAVGPKTSDATLKNVPTASDVLRATDGAVEHGPGWVSLLARDYQWRLSADVVNRGYSGMTSRLLKADLPAILSALPVSTSASHRSQPPPNRRSHPRRRCHRRAAVAAPTAALSTQVASREDVAAVVLMVGSNDVADGQASRTHDLCPKSSPMSHATEDGGAQPPSTRPRIRSQWANTRRTSSPFAQP